MTAQEKVALLQLSKKIGDLNTELLEIAKEMSADDGEELMQASAKLMLAQNNILKSVK